MKVKTSLKNSTIFSESKEFQKSDWFYSNFIILFIFKAVVYFWFA